MVTRWWAVEAGWHLEGLVMGYLQAGGLEDLLRAMFESDEAEVVLALPNAIPPGGVPEI